MDRIPFSTNMLKLTLYELI